MTKEGKEIRELRKLMLNSMYHDLKESFENILNNEGAAAARKYYNDNKENFERCYCAGYIDILLEKSFPYCIYNNGQCNIVCEFFDGRCRYDNFE
jgi:hypothetical protein